MPNLYRELATLIVLLVLTAEGLATDPIKDIINMNPNASVFQHASRNQPLVLKSKVAASRHFDEEDLAQLLKQVDFDEQFVLVFAWRGSGQDRLSYTVAESYPEQIFFKYQPGRTRDLRPHTYVYALRSNVVWRGPDGKPGNNHAGAGDDYIKVEVQGKLNSQIMAIGGETTGVTITARGVTWELDLGDKPNLQRSARQLHDQTVVVKGSLTVKQGVEIRQRWIVRVTSLIDANAKPDVLNKRDDK